MQQSGPKSAESERNGQALGYRETLIVSDFSVVGRFGQDAVRHFESRWGYKFGLILKGFSRHFRAPCIKSASNAEPLFIPLSDPATEGVSGLAVSATVYDYDLERAWRRRDAILRPET